MKPARGSSRSSTRGPKAKVRGERRLPQTGKVRLRRASHASLHLPYFPVPAEVQKGREKWKPLEKSSIVALDTMLSMSILTALTLRRKEKEESQKHLNLLKEQFLAKCSQLPVPVKKCGNMVQMSRQFQAESQKLKQGKSEIEAFEVTGSNLTLEQLQQEMDILEGKCRVMRARMAEEEERAQEVRMHRQPLGYSTLALLMLPLIEQGCLTMLDTTAHLFFKHVCYLHDLEIFDLFNNFISSLGMAGNISYSGVVVMIKYICQILLVRLNKYFFHCTQVMWHTTD
uniref:Centromere protein Q n=1 Tax=Electrophorus electricus TaxID=8005 RepID=A0A4W4GWI9_ELEEL